MNQNIAMNMDIIFGIDASAKSDRVYCARSSGLYHSDDLGKTWKQSYQDLLVDALLMTTSIHVNGESLFAGVPGGILVSDNGGANWKLTELGLPAPVIVKILTSPNFGLDGIAVAITAEDGVLRSEDRGQSWLPWNFGLVDQRISDVVFSPQFELDRTVYVSTETHIYQSKNQGRSWTSIGYPVKGDRNLSIGFSPSVSESDVLIVGTESHGLWCKQKSGWKEMSFKEKAVHAIYPVSGAAQIFVVTDTNVYRGETMKDTWQPLLPGDAENVITAFYIEDKENNDLRFWLGTSQGQIEVITQS